MPFVAAGQGAGEEDDFINPTRPTVSEGATVHRAGVLQLEYGGDFDFRSPEFRSQQSGPLGLQFAVTNRLRLDLDVGTFVSQKDRMGNRATGVGDVMLGFKAIARDKPKERLAVAFAYTTKLPAASDDDGLGTGRVDHHLRLIFNRTLGRVDYILNFSYLNVGRDDSRGRASGAQAIFRMDYELPQNFGINTEFYGQSVDEEQPRGLYVLGALTYKVNRRLRLDFGARPGFGRNAPRIGLFAGLTVGIADLYRKRR
ncbi:MAG: transporter [Pyrinomonadaceae bacterium]